MGKNVMTSYEFTKLQREFYKLNTVHLKVYEQDGNLPCRRQNHTANPADSPSPAWVLKGLCNPVLHLKFASASSWCCFSCVGEGGQPSLFPKSSC